MTHTSNHKTYGHFDDRQREFVITDPLTPTPWINYLGNTRMTALISQQAGGLAFYVDPQNRRLTRYHYLGSPPDRPGFYVYIHDATTGKLWNPHFAPVCEPLDDYRFRHGLGYSQCDGTLDDVTVSVRWFVPPEDDVLLWDVRIVNHSGRARQLFVASYCEFGLLEFQREMFWCYLRSHIDFDYDAANAWIRYRYHAFEAPYTPAVYVSCSEAIDEFDCSREAFCGPGGSLERPLALKHGHLTGSRLPHGGKHGCGVLGVRLQVPPGETKRLIYQLGAADDWAAAAQLCQKHRRTEAVDRAADALQARWAGRIGTFQVEVPDADVERTINTWNPLNARVTLERARDISTDHMGIDGLRYRDTMQDAMAVAHFDPEFARARIEMVLQTQARNGEGCFAFYPFTKKPHVTTKPERCDNTVWPVLTVDHWVRETGNVKFFETLLPFRDGGNATIYEHLLLGLQLIHTRRGPHGLPLLLDADWNDGLAVFGDRNAESVMLAMQLAHAAGILAGYANLLGHPGDAAWCRACALEMELAVNRDAVWDGRWYRRLLLRNGTPIGSETCPQGRIYLEPQVWAVISGVGNKAGRGRQAMDAVHDELDTPMGLTILTPPYTGIPTPDDPLTGNGPGMGENGSIFCHANTWAIIAECMLGRADRAFEYYRRLLPSVVCEQFGQTHWEREPYVFNSTILGPACGDAFGRGGISWLSGTASWMYLAGTQYILGIRPELDGLRIAPCLPTAWRQPITVNRRFRERQYRIVIEPESGAVQVNGESVPDGFLPV